MSRDKRLNRTQEVDGSSPFSSTTSDEFRRHQRGPDGQSRMQSLSTAGSLVEHAGETRIALKSGRLRPRIINIDSA